MPRIIYRQPTGERKELEVPLGHSVMEGAVDNGVPGILGDCGGACACATCHAYISDEWLPRLVAMDEMEDAMLDSAEGRQPNSRLTCQIEVTPELDGLELTVAPNEF